MHTYVCAHVYNSEGVQRCIAAGVGSIEHGQLADEETVRLIADTGTWWSIQPFLADEDANPMTDPRQREKQAEVAEGTVRAFELGRSLGARIAFGTDILFCAAGAASKGRQLGKLSRFMSPLEALHMATGAAGELLALSGTPRRHRRGRACRPARHRRRPGGRPRLARRPGRESAPHHEGRAHREGHS